jgi:hypothetical protein
VIFLLTKSVETDRNRMSGQKRPHDHDDGPLGLDEEATAIRKDVEASLADVTGLVACASIQDDRSGSATAGKVNIFVQTLEGDRIQILASVAGYELLQSIAANGSVRSMMCAG